MVNDSERRRITLFFQFSDIDRVRNAIRTIIYIREFDWTLEHFITFGVRTQDTYDMKQFLNSLQCSGFWNYRMFNL